jgi:hypothetical protein
MRKRTLSLLIGALFGPVPDAHAAACITAMQRIERSRNADVIARPMRELFDMLATGEVFEIDGVPSMRMPDRAARETGASEWVPVGPAIRGWIDFWRRFSPRMTLQRMQYLADRLDSGKPLTPRLVEQARGEFEATIYQIRATPHGSITSALTTTQIAWEFERIAKREAA